MITFNGGWGWARGASTPDLGGPNRLVFCHCRGRLAARISGRRISWNGFACPVSLSNLPVCDSHKILLLRIWTPGDASRALGAANEEFHRDILFYQRIGYLAWHDSG